MIFLSFHLTGKQRKVQYWLHMQLKLGAYSREIKFMPKKHHESLGRFISMLYRFRDVYLEHKLKPYDIGPSQLRILLALHRALHKEKEVNQGEIARRQRLDKSAMARSICKLEKQDWIKRTKSDKDKREYRITLTEKAHDKVHEFKAIRKGWNDTIAKGFSGEEKKLVMEFLRRMADNAHDKLHEMRDCCKEKE